MCTLVIKGLLLTSRIYKVIKWLNIKKREGEAEVSVVKSSITQSNERSLWEAQYYWVKDVALIQTLIKYMNNMAAGTALKSRQSKQRHEK